MGVEITDARRRGPPAALIITTFGALLAVSVIFTRGSQRFGVPVGTD